MVSICCSPPRHAPARPLAHARARLGNSANSLSSVQAGAPARGGLAADLEVLRHRELGEDAPVLRHVAEARAGRCGRAAGASMLAAGEAHLARGRRHQAHDRLHRRRLAGAVAAEQRHHLAGRRLERHAEQDVGAAVVGVQVRRRRASISPARVRRDRPPAPRGSARTSAGVPSAISRPRSSTMMRSAWAKTTSMSCSVNSTAIRASRASRAVERHQRDRAPAAPCRRSARPSAAAAAGWRAPSPARPA